VTQRSFAAGTGWRRLVAVLGLVLPAMAHATPTVTSTYPVTPLRVGSSSVELGFEASGQPAQLLVSVSGTSASGPFVSLKDVALKPDLAGAVPFHLLAPLDRAFPQDGVLTVTAVAIGLAGDRDTIVSASRDRTVLARSYRGEGWFTGR